MRLPGNITGEKIMGYSKVSESTGSVLELPTRSLASNTENNTAARDTDAQDLSSRDLMARLDEIKVLYGSETSGAGKKRLRNDARILRQLIVDNRRKVIYSTGSLLLAIALLAVLLQNIGLIQ
jgi:hypothetical protein